MHRCGQRAGARVGLGALLALAACQRDNSPCSPKATVVSWKTDGSIGGRWNAATQTMAYGRPGPDGHFRVYLSDADGNNEQRLTSALWPDNRHQFVPVWHPSGKYLFVEVEKTDHDGTSDDALPGSGGYTDLWLIRRDGTQAWKLYEPPNDDAHALTDAAITPDGRHFTFTERVKRPNILNASLAAGSYVFRVGDFVDGTPPQLVNLRPVQPGGVDQGGAVNGIAADGRTLVFSSTYATKNLLAARIYTMNLDSRAITQYSTDSFAAAPQLAPDQQSLIYTSGSQADVFPGELQGADWWQVSTDQTLRERLTCMNSANNPQSVNHYRRASSLSLVSAQAFFGDVLTAPVGLVGNIVRVSWE